MSFLRKISFFSFFVFVCLSLELSADEVCEVDSDLYQNGNFCGTNGLFAALNILGEVPETYEQLLTAFPNVQENGCSLLQIKAYLDKKTGLHSRLLWRKDKEIAELDGTKTVALAFVERKPMAHTFLILHGYYSWCGGIFVFQISRVKE